LLKIGNLQLDELGGVEGEGATAWPGCFPFNLNVGIVSKDLLNFSGAIHGGERRRQFHKDVLVAIGRISIDKKFVALR